MGVSAIIAALGVWRSPVAHLLWEQGVQGSNPCTPTSLKNGLSLTARFFICGDASVSACTAH
ncbi:MAG: hypothetical protein RL564_1838, partial [Pseudomonadota bacterium]